MKVTFKRSIGEKVWIMYENHIECGHIKNMWYRKYISNIDHETVVTVEKFDVAIKESKYLNTETIVSCKNNELFSDKESLIKSL